MSVDAAEDAVERRTKMKVMAAPDYADESFHALKWALDKLFTSMATMDAATPEGSPQNVDVAYLVHVQPKFNLPTFIRLGPDRSDLCLSFQIISI